jgi:predicted nuclease of restriction endonuclease-like (RecB) superfamily
MSTKSKRQKSRPSALANYSGLVGGIGELFESARRASARAVNAFMTATYWEVGRRIVEFEQGGADRAKYGDGLISRLSKDLGRRGGRGFSPDNLESMRQFYRAFPPTMISETLSRKSGERSVDNDRSPLALSSAANSETLSRKSATFDLRELTRVFPLPWSDYVLLVRRARSPEALAFYHTEALRGGWSVRQLQRQIDSQFYERTALSRNKAAMLIKGAKKRPGDAVSAEEEIRHPLVLEFLGLRDEYSETELEEGLVRHLESFLLELGNDFALVGRQRRLRIDDEWYRVDLLFFHRRLRCLVIFDLKLGPFTHADAGQMNVYVNYAREHWSQPGENPPVGVILCCGKSEALVRYATDSLPTKLLVREYLTALPDEKVLADELGRTRRKLEARK